MTNPNQDYDQRVIYVALTRMTNEHGLMQNAFQFWQENYSDKPLNIIEYCTKLVEYLGLTDGQKKNLMVAMHAASSRLPEDLPLVPAVLLNGRSEQVEAPTKQVDSKPKQLQKAHIIVATAFSQQIVQQLTKYHPQDARDLAKILKQEGINIKDSVLQTVVAHWATNGLAKLQFPDSISESQCSAFTHHLYLLVCELVGPVEADNIVNKVVQEVGKLDAALEFDPVKLT